MSSPWIPLHIHSTIGKWLCLHHQLQRPPSASCESVVFCVEELDDATTDDVDKEELEELDELDVSCEELEELDELDISCDI